MPSVLYAGLQDADKIAALSDTGLLMPAGHAATEAVPSAFCLDPEGRFLFAVADVGPRPAAIAAVRLGN